jgi:ER protein Pkr1
MSHGSATGVNGEASSGSSLRQRGVADAQAPSAGSEPVASADDANSSPLQEAITAGNKPGASFLDAIFSSLFQPGLNAPLHNLMNFTFFALFLVLFVLVFLTGGNIHVIVLLTISIGLWASVNWCDQNQDTESLPVC